MTASRRSWTGSRRALHQIASSRARARRRRGRTGRAPSARIRWWRTTWVPAAWTRRRASYVADRRSVSLTGLATHEVELSADLVYSHAGGRPRLLDLYLPRGVARPLPVIVWLHAGGWRSGDRKQAPDLSRHFAV